MKLYATLIFFTMEKNKPVRITRDLIIAALAYRCPNRTDTNPIYAACVDFSGHRTSCNPRLCTHCTDIFKDMAKIAEEGIYNYL